MNVLFLMPSLALMAQSVVGNGARTAVGPVTAFPVCSDTQVGKRRWSVELCRGTGSDRPGVLGHDRCGESSWSQSRALPSKRCRIVFASYQSIQLSAQAQTQHGMPEFDLIVCDEAHRYHRLATFGRRGLSPTWLRCLTMA